MKWQNKLKKLVEYYQENSNLPDPFFLYDPKPPTEHPWPSELPGNVDLKDFYKLCGGGGFGPMLRFIPLCDLVERTNSWIKTLSNYNERGDILKAGRHVVFANDADGTPWIWDSKTGEVASFYWKGGDWEKPQFKSFNEFMEYVFIPEKEDNDWHEVLRIILGDNA